MQMHIVVLQQILNLYIPTFPCTKNQAMQQPQIKGYRIYEQVHADNDKSKADKLDILVKISYKIPHNYNYRIVVCNGKVYNLPIPQVCFSSKIQTIEFNKELQKICIIINKSQQQDNVDSLFMNNYDDDEPEKQQFGFVPHSTEIKLNEIEQIRREIYQHFRIKIKIDQQELFLSMISDQFNENQLTLVLDLVNDMDFSKLVKNIFDYCPTKIIPKIYRKFNKYFSLTKKRSNDNIERLKRILKIAKQCEAQQKQSDQKQQQVKKVQQLTPKVNIQQKSKENKWQFKPVSQKKQQKLISKKVQNKQQLPIANQKKIIPKVTKAQPVQPVSKKSKNINESNKPIKTKTPQKSQPQDQSQNWQDVSESDDSDNMLSVDGQNDSEVQDAINQIVLDNEDWDWDSAQEQQYLNLNKEGKKKEKKSKGKPYNPIKQIPKVSQDVNYNAKQGQKHKQNHQKQFKQHKQHRQQKGHHYLAEKKQQNNLERNQNQGRGRGRGGRDGGRQFNDRNNDSSQKWRNDKRGGQSKQNKKIDSRIMLGINGASDLVWREKMRARRNPSPNKWEINANRGQVQRPNYQKIPVQHGKGVEQSSIPNVIRQEVRNKNKELSKIQTNQTQIKRVSGPATLQKVFCYPMDSTQGKKFKFQKRSYNIFVNNLFWVNVSKDGVTIQKDGKGFMRKGQIQVIDNGNGIMADGITLNIEGLSNLQDGGTPFGNPKFEEFTPNGQWFHIIAMEVYTYT